MHCLRIYPKQRKRTALEESWKHHNRHCLLDHTSFFVPQSLSESKDKDGKNLIMKIRIAIRGWRRAPHRQGEHGEGFISHTTHVAMCAAHADDQPCPVDAWAWGGGSWGACVGVGGTSAALRRRKRTLAERCLLFVSALQPRQRNNSQQLWTPQIAQPAIWPC